MKHGKDSILKNIIRYSSSHYYRQFLGVITAFIRPRLLSPELFGLWNLLKIIETYADYAHLGVFSSMKYLIPFHESRNEREEIRSIKGSALKGSFYFFLLLSILLVFFSFKPDISIEARVGLLAFALIVMLIWYYNYYLALLKALQNFRLISAGNYIYYTSLFILNIVLIYLFGIYGAYLSVAISLILIIVFFRLKHTDEKTEGFKADVFRKLISHGFAIMLFNLGAIVIRTSDRFIVAAFLGNRELGYYGIAIMILGFLMNVPGASREVIEPVIMRAVKAYPEKAIKEYFIIPLLNTAYIMPFLIAGTIFALPVFMPLFLPRYIPGIIPSNIIVIGGYFLALSYTARGVIVSHNLQLKAAFIMLIPLFFNIFLSILLIKLDFGIAGVAIASSISFFILLASILVFISRENSIVAKELKSNLIYFIYPFLVMCVLIFLLDYGERFLIINPYFLALVKLSVFCFVFLVLLILTRTKHTLIQNCQSVMDKISGKTTD